MTSSKFLDSLQLLQGQPEATSRRLLHAEYTPVGRIVEISLISGNVVLDLS
jgi:hypothetical protein